MSIEDKIYDIAKKGLVKSGLPDLFTDSGLPGPFLGEAKPCEYYTNGYEVPINVKYNNHNIYLGSCMVSRDGNKYHVPDSDFALVMFKHGIESIEKLENDRLVRGILASFSALRKGVEDILAMNDYFDYEEFRYDVMSGYATNEPVIQFFSMMIESMPQMKLKSFLIFEPKSFCLDAFPGILANYFLEERIKDARLDQALDHFIALNKRSHDMQILNDELIRRNDEDDHPTLRYPILAKVTKGNKGFFSELDLFYKGDDDIFFIRDKVLDSIAENMNNIDKLRFENYYEPAKIMSNH